MTIISGGTKALSSSYDGSIRVWRLAIGSYMKQSSSPGHLKDVTDIALARGGSACISASNDGTFKVWECDTAEQCFTVRGAV